MYNFGKIKHNIYSIVSEGIVNKDLVKKSILKEFISTIKKSKILLAEAKIYNNIENKSEISEYLATEYIKENINLLNGFTKKEILSENKKLSNLLDGHNIVEFYDKFNLHDNIHNLIVTTKTPNTINNIVESTNIIKEYVNSNVTEEKVLKEDLLPNSILSKFLVEKYNQKYSTLNENDTNFIKSMLENDETKQESVLSKLKDNILINIDESIEESSDINVKSKLLDVKNRLINTKYLKESFSENIIKLITLRENLKK